MLRSRSHLVLLLSCFWIAAAPAAETESIDQFFDRYTNDWVRTNPNLATSLRYFSGEEQAQLERQLTPQTREYQKQRVQMARKGLEELRRFDLTKLNDTQRLSAGLMDWLLEGTVRSEPFRDYYFPLQQFSGANVNLVETFTLQHPLVTAKDAENFVARLAQADDRMNEVLVEANARVAKNMLPPRFIVQATRASMQTFVDAPVDANPIVTVFAQKTSGIKDLPADRRDALQKRVAELVKTEIYPAWHKAIAMLDAITPRTTDDAGLWRFKGGDAAYANALLQFTTTTLTPDQIHEIGLKQVAAIEAQMDGILKGLGRTEGTVQARMKKLEEDLRYSDPTSDASREQIMKDIDVLMKDAVVRSTPMFERMPVTPVIAQPFPRFREASAAANYNRAPLDNSRPAIFQMPLRVQRMTKLGLRTLVYHETIPGHHYQIALEQENTALPRFRQARALGGISAMSEGWALYAEKLAAESGWYEGDPEGLLGQLSAELWRARRLVVDTGLHAKKWTRQQAIDYGIEGSEIDRYVVNPGQACSYMIGQLRILEMRDKARAALGDKFSLRAFHSTVLNTGTMPLGALEKEVDRYVQSVKAQ